MTNAHWTNPVSRIHGIYKNQDDEPKSVIVNKTASGEVVAKAEGGFVLFLIGEVLRKLDMLRAITGCGNQRVSLASNSLREHFELLVRSIQLIGETNAKAIDLHEAGQITINEHRDLIIAYDMTLTYASMIADTLALIITPVFHNGGFPNQDYDNLQSMIDDASKGNSNYTCLLTNVNLDWFQKLKTLRNHRVHRSAIQGLSGPVRVNGEIVSRKMTSQLSGRSFLSTDLARDISTICDGLFGFLDYIAREVAKKETDINLSAQDYTEWGRIVVIGDSGFLEAIIPIIESPIS